MKYRKLEYAMLAMAMVYAVCWQIFKCDAAWYTLPNIIVYGVVGVRSMYLMFDAAEKEVEEANRRKDEATVAEWELTRKKPKRRKK